MSRLIIFFVFLAFEFSALGNESASEVTVQECEQKVTQWYPSNAQLDRETWKKAFLWFLSKEDAANKCLLTIVDGKDSTSARLWAGSFNSNGSRTILNSWAALGAPKSSDNPRGRSSTTPSMARFIKKCNRGATTLSRNSQGQMCGYAGSCASPATIAYMEQQLGGVKVTSFITYGVNLNAGQIMFHDGLQCEQNIQRSPQERGRKCVSTQGCITLHPLKMRKFCEVYLGDSVSGGQGSPGGTYFFVNSSGSGMPATNGSCQSSNVRKLMKKIIDGQACTNIPNITIDEGGSSTLSSSTRSLSNASRSRNMASDNGAAQNTSSSSNSKNIFDAIKDFFASFSGGSTSSTPPGDVNANP